MSAGSRDWRRHSNRNRLPCRLGHTGQIECNRISCACSRAVQRLPDLVIHAAQAARRLAAADGAPADAPGQLVQQGHSLAGAGGASGVPKRDGAAVGVHLVIRQAKLAHAVCKLQDVSVAQAQRRLVDQASNYLCRSGLAPQRMHSLACPCSLADKAKKHQKVGWGGVGGG